LVEANTPHLRNREPAGTLLLQPKLEETAMGRGILLWLLGVPIPIIILLWLFFGH
jgi:hypothetical protein